MRQKHESELNRLVGAAMGQQDAAVWQERFVALGIPGATVLGIRDAFAHPQAVARRMLQGFGGPHPVAHAVQVAGNPLRVRGEPMQAVHPLPGVGADARAVMDVLLRMPPEQQAVLRQQRVVWWPDSGLVYERPSVV